LLKIFLNFEYIKKVRQNLSSPSYKLSFDTNKDKIEAC